ncbi:DNA (cytosine-5)-methyltransferase 1 [Rhizobium sp. SG_E_25_P2]|uniref:DNA cytosine methyltransferase n=1 Tax=Rhizobium sp. SG_E_25_P2 TaxID=2879942 RepID=UPI002474BD1D|nr:DNA cytosine methyltransferase [Rhizobium sp. SG_E_25_P2]MDH6268460.1 DNA (cytosine-5)-methyltransferase 1 [Rhizobium sp. SG_E_25_P2]
MQKTESPGYYEFFAGGGMVRAGLGDSWSCLFANDLDAGKARAYRANWGGDWLKLEDINRLAAADLPGRADLAWASFPCQDLSLAGAGAGLGGARSGTFWTFWRLMQALKAEGRAPSIIALENVCGALTSHGGRDFAALGEALAAGGYRFGAMVVDAAAFLPQSRPRLFIVAVKQGLDLPADCVSSAPSPDWHTPALIAAHARLSPSAADHWLWWRLPAPARRNIALIDLVETDPRDARWLSEDRLEALLAMMDANNRAKIDAAKGDGVRRVGALYKRTRPDGQGGKVQRAEIRFDGLAGCLRTPAGGSSRQSILIVEGDRLAARLLTARETARLMGLPDAYVLPRSYTEAYHLTGDGVAVPVVRHLARHLFEPLLAALKIGRRAA